MDETQNDAPFVAFYDMHAVTFVPPDEMADMMAKIWTNGDTVICLSRKHCGKRRNCSLRSNFSFSHNVFKRSLLLMC